MSRARLAPPSANKPHLVAALAYDRLCTFEFGCVVEVFGQPRPELDVQWYRFGVCADQRGPLRAMGGLSFSAPYTLRLLDKADTIVIPGWRDADEAPPDALLRRVQAAWRRGARLCSICSGVFVLAAADVMPPGTRVTTHWRYADRLAQRFPRLSVEPQALYLDQGQIVTAAGSAAGLDMLVHLVRRDFGPAVANTVAQRLVIAPHRHGGQTQFVPKPLPLDERGRLARLMDWVRDNPALPHDTASLARQASMSVRSLQRQFRDSAGLAPHQWIVSTRVALARDLLETTDLPLQQVGERVGFGSEEAFRRQFRQIAAIPPGDYRRKFSRTR